MYFLSNRISRGPGRIHAWSTKLAMYPRIWKWELVTEGEQVNRATEEMVLGGLVRRFLSFC